MTFAERWLAKLGIAGVLVILLTLSLAANLWQLSREFSADARCARSIANLQDGAQKVEQSRALAGQEIAREVRAEASAQQAETITETAERAERVRTITRTIEVPANCPTALPERVRDELREATRAANRRL